MNKIRERARLLKAYRKTGDEDYRRAAEALKIPLLDHVRQLDLYPGRRRGPTVAKQARARLYRMHRMVIAGTKVYPAAVQEVDEHGRGAHTSEEAAIDYLRSQYPKEEKRIAETIAIFDHIAETHRQFERSAQRFAQAVRASFPADLISSTVGARWALWSQRLDGLARLMRHPIAVWRNTLPKNGREKIQ